MPHFSLSRKIPWLLSARIFNTVGQLEQLHNPALFEGKLALLQVGENSFAIYQSNGLAWEAVSEFFDPSPPQPSTSKGSAMGSDLMVIYGGPFGDIQSEEHLPAEGNDIE